MYFTFTKSAARAGYRATNEEAEKVDEGLYGVNSEGNFIYITNQERPSGTEGLAHGDYIISLAPMKTLPPEKSTIQLRKVRNFLLARSAKMLSCTTVVCFVRRRVLILLGWPR